jgi:hypothetical protein
VLLVESVAMEAVTVTVVSAFAAQPLSVNVTTAYPSGCVVAGELIVALPAGHDVVKFTVAADVKGASP